MDSIPIELVVSILRYLSLKDLRRFRSISKRFGKIIEQHDNALQSRIPVDMVAINQGIPPLDATICIDCKGQKINLSVLTNNGEFEVKQSMVVGGFSTFSTSYLKNNSLEEFLRKFLSAVRIQVFRMAFFRKNAVIHQVVEKVFTEQTCRIGQFDFCSGLSSPHLSLLTLHKKDAEKPIVCLGSKNVYLALESLVPLVSFYQIQIKVETKAEMEILKNGMANMWSINANIAVPGCICLVEENPALAIYETEFEQVPGSLKVEREDGKVLNFKGFLLDDKHPALSYYANE